MKFDPKDFWGISEIEVGDRVRVTADRYNVTKIGSEGIVRGFGYDYRKGDVVRVEFLTLNNIYQIREKDLQVVKKHQEVNK